MIHVQAQDLKVGDVILPPEREIRLWMRRALQEKGLEETALYLTIKEIYEAKPDKRGSWLFVKCDQTPEWIGNNKPWTFGFKVRPETPWPKIS